VKTLGESIREFFVVEVTPFKMPVYGTIKGIPPRLQFLGLPVDVNSL
jgi:hypothetical protein